MHVKPKSCLQVNTPSCWNIWSSKDFVNLSSTHHCQSWRSRLCCSFNLAQSCEKAIIYVLFHVSLCCATHQTLAIFQWTALNSAKQRHRGLQNGRSEMFKHHTIHLQEKKPISRWNKKPGMVWFAKESAILRPVGHDRIEGAAATTTADTRRMAPTNFNTRCKMLLINSPRPPPRCLYGSSTWAQESFPRRLPPSEAHTYNVKLLSLVPFNSCWCTRKLPTFLLKKWELWSHKRSKHPRNRSTTILTLRTNFQLLNGPKSPLNPSTDERERERERESQYP